MTRDNSLKTEIITNAPSVGSINKLHVHHTYYQHGLKAWEYPDDSLITLCGKCHKEHHDTNKLKIRVNPNRKPALTKEQRLLRNKQEFDKMFESLADYHVANNTPIKDIPERSLDIIKIKYPEHITMR